ncbi:MAG: pyruvate, phosphate dikinase [Bacteroidetes bacterium]|nr:pyruvate, phosphate dikinase [Bacteroidota bacterium]
MSPNTKNIHSLVHELEERAKELNCIYSIEDYLNDPVLLAEEKYIAVVNAIPGGFQFPEITRVRIVAGSRSYESENFSESRIFIKSDISVNDTEYGSITVYYTKETPQLDEGPFLKEEKKLLSSIADRLRNFIRHEESKTILHNLKEIKDISEEESEGSWRIVIEMLNKTDPVLYKTILRKLLHHLCWNDIKEAIDFLTSTSSETKTTEEKNPLEENKPIKRKILDTREYEETILSMTGKYMKDDEIIEKIQKWITDDKISNLVKAVENYNTSLQVISEILRKHYKIALEKNEVSTSIDKGLRVSLLRRFFTEQIDYITTAKEHVDLEDFYDLIDRIIFTPESHGKLGGKSAGLFLASNILKKSIKGNPLLKNVKVPKTWYIPSDGIIQFLQYNNLEEVIEQKYKEIEEIRREYHHIIQIFKNSSFPPEMVKGLSVALDDLGDKPLIVRSSSLLEDQVGAAFSGKYKSLFIANTGTKAERLNALMDAIAEVYASTFSPDPIEYRAERGLLDFHEEMGIMIQQVVGERIGDYFFPSFAGVAFSNNEFRWSPRIKREDGLIRMVAGLGTRAVDRLSDDYPVLIAPGQPNLRVNITFEDILRYSPQKIDVINLGRNEFQTMDAAELLGEIGEAYPGINNIISLAQENHLVTPIGFVHEDFHDDVVITFEGLVKNTEFIKRVNLILKILQEKTGAPVDIEFASDGIDFYMLQCRPQSKTRETAPDPSPRDIPADRILFSANKYISNGKVPEITHVVYVDPGSYYELESREELLDVGRAIGRLNKLLPKRQFILMGPGRWGSRGDIKLGVNVTYSDINNTAMLIEVARKKGNYVPDLSFGTHFFQDLVEASIRYLPLYPDDNGNAFNELFLMRSENIFKELMPEFPELGKVVKVIDVPKVKDGMILRVLVNADFDEAVAFFSVPSLTPERNYEESGVTETRPADHWKWRFKMAEQIARQVNPSLYGIKGMYVLGSTKNATAGPGSDIDLLVHIGHYGDRIEELKLWLEGWSLCLSEMNYIRTGYKTSGLLDVHFVTDADITNKTSWAAKINAVTDAAKPLQMKNP